MLFMLFIFIIILIYNCAIKIEIKMCLFILVFHYVPDPEYRQTLVEPFFLQTS